MVRSSGSRDAILKSHGDNKDEWYLFLIEESLVVGFTLVQELSQVLQLNLVFPFSC